MDMESGVPPGFRFHPTEEELVGYYLKRKINALKIDLDVIVDVDLYKIEPWDIQEKCKLGYDEQNEWYFFSHKDRKYPTGTRTNRATAAGFWKATGRDKAVLSKNKMIGMRKTLVYYKGRAPNGRKTDWIMHEYRLQTSERGPPQEEGWVVCRAFWKRTPTQRQCFDAWTNACYMRDNGLLRPPTLSEGGDAHRLVHADQCPNYCQLFGSGQELFSNNTAILDSQLVEIPQLDSPTISTSLATKGIQPNAISTEDYDDDGSHTTSQYIDWKNLDNLLGSHLTSDSVSLISHSNMLSMPHSYQPDIQDQVSNCLDILTYKDISQ